VDAGLLVAGALAWLGLRLHHQLAAGDSGVIGTFSHELLLAGTYVGFVISLTHGRQLLGQRLVPSAFPLCTDAIRACTFAAVLAIGIQTLLGLGGGASMAASLWLITLAQMCVIRAVLSFLGRRARRRGSFTTPTVVVGAGLIGAKVVRRLTQNTEYGLRPVGFLDTDPRPDAIDPDNPVAVLGSPDQLAEVCEQTGAGHVILAFASERDHRLVELVSVCRRLGVEVSVVPRLYESVNERAKLDHIGGLPLLSLGAVDPYGWQFGLKHVMDRLLAALALIVLSPLLIAIAIAVKLSSPGPMIFRQRRVGRDGRIFDVLKFRTMREIADAKPFVPRPGAAPGGVEGIDRRTAIGRWLRCTSLDELPQLINVLKGEMSIVGPRPERPEFAEQFAREVHGYQHRLRVKSGITGWAQVNGLRGQTSIDDRVEWDNHYIENWSPMLDLWTIVLTVVEVLRFREDAPKAPQQPSPQVAGGRATLELVANNGAIEEADVSPAATWFCGYCGSALPQGATPTPMARVCGQCGQGLMLEVRADGAPRNGEAFLIVDSHLCVQAVSQQAEKVLGVQEQEATDRPVAELLVAADVEATHGHSLVDLVERAASSDGQPYATFIRPRNTFGVRMRARVIACGPPRAALIVFESEPPTGSRSTHLQLVPEAAGVEAGTA
jgi:exopolysaccharide biosynthesis polyprenyl glycosylphosphotransferase